MKRGGSKGKSVIYLTVHLCSLSPTAVLDRHMHTHTQRGKGQGREKIEGKEADSCTIRDAELQSAF